MLRLWPERSCRWESINLIGELNIIKACTVLVTDFADGDSPEELLAASANLTGMQARISFVGPILGMGGCPAGG